MQGQQPESKDGVKEGVEEGVGWKGGKDGLGMSQETPNLTFASLNPFSMTQPDAAVGAMRLPSF